MSQATMRGMRLGSQSLESERGVNYEARTKFSFQCPMGHVTELAFAADAEIPQTWECRSCSKEAVLLADGKMVDLGDLDLKTPRSHWQMLLERRTEAELEEILQERLDYIRGRRAGGKVDF